MKGYPKTTSEGIGKIVGTETIDPRQAALRAWLEDLGIDPTDLEPVAADAGNRRYFRVPVSGGFRVVMDAPHQSADCLAYLRIGRLMAHAGVHIPRVYQTDLQQGFLLLEDLGSQHYLAALQRGEFEGLMEDALTALVRWQAATGADWLPHYDHQQLRRELDLFPNWYVQRHLGWDPDRKWWARWHAGSQLLVDAATRQPQVWVHRDFMARNLLVSVPNPGVIDFQDAVLGPVTYDLVSLLRDAFFQFTPDQEQHCIARYQALAAAYGIPVPEDLLMALDWMGAQRHLKVLGVCARLCHRDGKPRYIADAPRFMAYLDRECSPYGPLADLHDLIQSLPVSAEHS